MLFIKERVIEKEGMAESSVRCGSSRFVLEIIPERYRYVSGGRGEQRRELAVRRLPTRIRLSE